MDYIKSHKELKKKDLLLIGSSERAAISAIAASKRSDDVFAIVQFSATAVFGREMADYQSYHNDSIYISEHGFIMESFFSYNF